METIGSRAAIRPFAYYAPQAELDNLRRRILATRLPEPPGVPERSRGVQRAAVRQLARYWAERYDWRRAEARINSYPQFLTGIDGLDIHFIHVRSRHEDALPLIITHGWPRTIVSLLKIIDPLTNPTAHGGKAADAFDVVMPSIPGSGFSGKPATTGWAPTRIAKAWAVLMKRLGYERYAAQDGDRAAVIADVMSAHGHPELAGMHANMAVALADSPVALAAFLLDFPGGLPYARAFDGRTQDLSRDDILDNITFFWLTDMAVSAARLCAYPGLVHRDKPDKGGPFPAWEQPRLFVEELRTGLKTLRA
jgi:hypothetical protein